LSRRHDLYLQENLLVDLVGAVFLPIGQAPYWIVVFAKPICIAWPQLVAYASGRWRANVSSNWARWQLRIRLMNLGNRGRRDRTDALGYSL